MNQEDTAVILDLEFTAWPGSRARRWTGPGEHREIIQIGALKVRAADATLLDRFERVVRPRINPQLSAFITELTGIDQDRLTRDGIDFEAAYTDFLDFAGDAPLFCYGFDEVVIAENIALYGLEDRFTATNTTNLHAFFRRHGVEIEAVDSGSLSDHFGLDRAAPGKAHDAVFDCLSALAAARHLVAKGEPSPFLSPNPTFGPDGPEREDR